MDSGGPYLNAALLCERVLNEKDGVLSVVRIIDRLTITVFASGTAAPETLPPGIVNVQALVIFKAGLFKGSAPVRLVINSPSGQVIGESSADVFFEGDDRGVNLISQLQLQVHEEGLHWVDVHCLGQLFTRIPLRVIYQRMNQGSLKW